MAEPKENKSFFRKVVQFVSNPTLEWSDLNSRQDDTKDLERSELRAMVERKRRNDFVRKREFDMLRRVRREGLSAEQLAALGPSSRLDETEAPRPGGDSLTARTQGVVKAKIDHIEREMVGDTPGFRGSKNTAFFDAPTEPGVLSRRGPGSMAAQLGQDLPQVTDVVSDGSRLRPGTTTRPDVDLTDVPILSEPAIAPMQMSPGLGPLAPVSMDSRQAIGGSAEFPVAREPLGVEVETAEIVHDPELDEAVIAFANADFSQCERSLQQLIGPGGLRAQHAETWLVMFDLYRATGQQQNFESLAMDYAHRFGWSAPQWFSMPRLVAEAAVAAGTPAQAQASASGGEVGWISPTILDTDAVSRLRSQTLQLPLPWVLDWSGLKHVEAEAATQLSTLFRLWAGQAIEMRWIGGDRLFTALAEAAPTGVRDADPAFWLARLDALRLANRADQFDEAAIDYCVTYEVSPPSWEPTRCTVRMREPGHPTLSPQLSVFSDVSTSFHESGLTDPGSTIQVAHVELSGQLVNDLSDTLARINASLEAAPVVMVSCAHLIRVDFIAAGDLLNWVLARRNEGRQVQFTDTHRLIALFFGAMGINEHARVQVRRV